MNEYGEKIIGVIPARGGSKGIARKNLRHVYGKSLLEWTIENSTGARSLDEIVVSSEDAQILSWVRGRTAVKALERPAEFATDEASVIDVVFHAIEKFPGFDWIVLLQPTSPFRIAEDIEGALRTARDLGAPACVSVTAAAEHPYFSYRVDDSGNLVPFFELKNSHVRRQEVPPAYRLNGAVYVARTEFIISARSFLTSQTVAYVMPDERSLDIDTEQDLEKAEVLFPQFC